MLLLPGGHLGRLQRTLAPHVSHLLRSDPLPLCHSFWVAWKKGRFTNMAKLDMAAHSVGCDVLAPNSSSTLPRPLDHMPGDPLGQTTRHHATTRQLSQQNLHFSMAFMAELSRTAWVPWLYCHPLHIGQTIPTLCNPGRTPKPSPSLTPSLALDWTLPLPNLCWCMKLAIFFTGPADTTVTVAGINRQGSSPLSPPSSCPSGTVIDGRLGLPPKK